MAEPPEADEPAEPPETDAAPPTEHRGSTSAGPSGARCPSTGEPARDRVPVAPRAELMAPYERPYRWLLAFAWSTQEQLRAAAITTTVVGLAGLGFLVGGASDVALAAALIAVASGCVVLLWIALVTRLGAQRVRAWSVPTELGNVRAARPHAGDADPDVAHPEFAVTVEDDGHLVTWRFRPLTPSQQPADDELEVPGRPRYAAAPIDRTICDADDTAEAGERLAAAQQAAAQREAGAAERARTAIAERVRRRRPPPLDARSEV